MKKVIKKISAIVMAFTLLGTGSTVTNFISSKSNVFTAKAASEWKRWKITTGNNKGMYQESRRGWIYTNGNAKLDGVIDIEDVIIIMDYINGNYTQAHESLEFKAAADVNWDQKIDIQDAVMILNHINGIKALP